MADNYLEDKYESYQARKAAWERAEKPGMKKSHTLIKKAPDPQANDEDKPEPDDDDRS